MTAIGRMQARSWSEMRGTKAIVLSAAMVLAPLTAADTPSREESRQVRRTPVVEVFESARDAVVNISSTQIVTVRSPFGGLGRGFEELFEHFDMPMPLLRDPFGGDRQVRRQSVGSGFVIHPDGYIVTNAHVVARTAERRVTFADGREYDATVVAADPQRDLAILKIEPIVGQAGAESRSDDAPGGGGLPTLRLGRSDDLMIGETVIAIGNPLGYQHTVTSGVVSAVGRDLVFSSDFTLENLIQTDASINPGNSGGPLLNVLGELIGINTAIRGDAQNIGFAIPVDRLREVLPELLDIERRYRLIAGLHIDTLNTPRIIRVDAGSPAERADIRVGDVLLAVDGRPVREGIDYYIAMIGRNVDRPVALTLERDGSSVDVDLRFEHRPLPDGRELALRRLGIELDDLHAEVARRLGLRPDVGVVIDALDPRGPAAQIGLQRGDIIVALGRHSVGSLEQVGLLLEHVGPAETVSVNILRLNPRQRGVVTRMTATLRTR
jgi:serine protease Do